MSRENQRPLTKLRGKLASCYMIDKTIINVLLFDIWNCSYYAIADIRSEQHTDVDGRPFPVARISLYAWLLCQSDNTLAFSLFVGDFIKSREACRRCGCMREVKWNSGWVPQNPGDLASMVPMVLFWVMKHILSSVLFTFIYKQLDWIFNWNFF